MIVNTNKNDKLSGYHTLHLIFDDVVVSKSVNNWISTDPVALYRTIMKLSNNAVLLPDKTPYVPSLQQVVFKKLESKVQLVDKGLVFQTKCRRVIHELRR